MDKNVWIYTEGLSREEIKRYHLHPVDSLEKIIRTLLAKYGHKARWAVVPDGPMVILKIATKN
jgi:hypothetical protein